MDTRVLTGCLWGHCRWGPPSPRVHHDLLWKRREALWLSEGCQPLKRALKGLGCMGTAECRGVAPWMDRPRKTHKTSSICLTETRHLRSAQSLSRVRLFATPRTAPRQASLSFTNSRSLLKLTSIESVMSSNHLTLCHPLLLPPSIFSSIRVFSNELALHIRWPKVLEFQL